MSLISINSVAKDFGVKPLFNNLTFVINPKERVALLGANGSGKSTLLKMIVGLEKPDSGEIVLRRDSVSYYVKQTDTFPDNATPLSYLLDQAVNLAEHQAEKLLHETGFSTFQSENLVSLLSGGMKKRLSVLAGLANKPDILLLDEPTNHLDIPGILWLEQALTNFNGAILFISHDRFFVERVAKRTIELDSRFPNGFVSADGGYSALIEKRESLLEQLRSNRESLQNKVRREVEWLRAGVKARTTKSKYRSDEAHRLINELNSIQLEKQSAELGFAATGRKTKELIKLDNITGGISENIFWKNLTLTVYPGSRIGIVGANGAGKTTLLKTIVGDIPVIKGRILKASNLKINYFGQMREQLNPNLTVKQFLCPDGDSVVFQNREIHIVTWARRFLFNKDELSHKVCDLSGGEQARLLLAKLSLTDSDILVFDEPTNDLDIQTLEILEQSFIEYPGAILIVSHDRYLMSRVCTTIIGFIGDIQNNQRKLIQCADYLQFEEAWDSSLVNQTNTIQNQDSKVSESQLSFQEKKELQSLERKIATLETKIEQHKQEINDPQLAFDHQKLIDIQGQIDKLKDQLEEHMNRWLELQS